MVRLPVNTLEWHWSSRAIARRGSRHGSFFRTNVSRHTEPNEDVGLGLGTGVPNRNEGSRMPGSAMILSVTALLNAWESGS